MTLRLILIRHAKSSWGDLNALDHERTLNERGRRSAPAIGEWLKNRSYLPDQVLCSDAVRTRETLSLIAPYWDTPQVSFLPSLYLATAHAMLNDLHRATAKTVAIIGHNPGIGSLAAGLLHTRPAHPRFTAYPTCATTIIDFPHDTWPEVAAASGVCVDFVVPRDLLTFDPEND